MRGMLKRDCRTRFDFPVIFMCSWIGHDWNKTSPGLNFREIHRFLASIKKNLSVHTFSSVSRRNAGVECQ